MGQEMSVSYQAVKSKVYKMIDALVEGTKTEAEVQDSMRRWWNMIHPSDRPVARKYLSMVLERSQAGLRAIAGGVPALKPFDIVLAPAAHAQEVPDSDSAKLPKLNPVTNRNVFSSTA